ncbi:hypothetical protein Bbelb_068310, partial [Branchiostoma belcheri]
DLRSLCLPLPGGRTRSHEHQGHHGNQRDVRDSAANIPSRPSNGTSRRRSDAV